MVITSNLLHIYLFLYHIAKARSPSRKGVVGRNPKSCSNGVVSAYVTGTSPGCIGTSSLCASKS